MKNSDIALVVLLAAVSIAISYWLGNLILGDPNDDTYKITYVDSISSEVAAPDIETFNPAALNPTVEVIIGKCKEDETYDTYARKCVPKNQKDNNNGKDGGEENPENPENPDPENPEPDNPED